MQGERKKACTKKPCATAYQRRALAVRRDRNQRSPPSWLDSSDRIHAERTRTAHRSGLTVLEYRDTRDLYAAYKVWREDNAENPLSPKSFSSFIAQNADAYRLEATNNVYIGSGKRCRDYVGIEVLIRPTAL